MRLEQLTFTRFIAAIAIVIYHFGADVFPFNHVLLASIFRSSYAGVSYFYVLSGFVMIIAYSKRAGQGIDKLQFYKNRFARVYPVYFLALLLIIAFYIIDKRFFTGTEIGLSVFALQAWIPPYPLSLNTPAWSLSVEILFYILFPFLFDKVYHTISLKKVTVFVFIFWIITQVLFNTLLFSSYYKEYPSTSHDLLFYFPIMHLSSFLAGNVAGLYFVKRVNQPKKKNGFLILLLVLILITIYNLKIPVNFQDGALAIIFVPFIYCLSLNQGFTSRICRLKLFIFLGEISYGIYILQKPVFKFGREYIGQVGITNTDTQFYCITLILILLSAVSFVYIETPLRKRIKKIGQQSISLPAILNKKRIE